MRFSLFILCLIAAIIFNFTGSLKAEISDGDPRWGGSPLHKLERGAINIITCPIELPASMLSVADEKGEIFGFFIGAAEGVFTALFRALSGIYDTATFLIPSYSKPIMEPEYAIQSLEDALK
ncbi:MAG: exosortase system-associated protein, TIGR04073 family [Candidatus Omnitrophica bacterium]|jgi:putative exosortase-associated protein (TIGR04073 family)|nr:exosortase system-associated protein, TIGR04073 family [Candidatus Omnitrophota bacterium]MDD5691098.1 exosortase system-associated protein, TIGR04073 family [Candidatus Omnitrophota bacterium]